MKVNFATRVAMAGTMKSDVSGSANNKRMEVQAEINANPVKIDRKVFVKDELEKELVKVAKAKHKLYLTKQ